MDDANVHKNWDGIAYPEEAEMSFFTNPGRAQRHPPLPREKRYYRWGRPAVAVPVRWFTIGAPWYV